MTEPTPEIKFTAYGVPQPGGSKKGFVNPRNGRVIIVEDAKRNKSWRESVLQAALPHAPKSPLTGPLSVVVTFCMPRPKNHYRTGKNSHLLRPDAPEWHTKKPDATKLWRSTEDALTGIIWADDSQIARQAIVKTYTAGTPCAIITILPIEG